MTTQALNLSTPTSDTPAPNSPERRASRSFFAQAIADTFSRPGACLGAAWIVLLALAAVFAPFIASSFPIAVKVNGGWASPMLKNLTPADVTLLAVFFTAVALLITRRVGFPTAMATVLWVVALMLPLTLWPSIRDARHFGISHRAMAGLIGLGVVDLFVLMLIPALSRAPLGFKVVVALCASAIGVGLVTFPVDPPINVVWDQYRTMEKAGQFQAVYRTIVPFSPSDYQRDDQDARLQPPSARHWMGTEGSGADVFSRMLHASRIALSIGFIATGISVTIGVTIGGLMGYFAGVVDILGMRLIEIVESVPSLILLLTVCAFFGRNLYLMMAIIGFLSWPGDARFIRGEFLRLRKQDFVQAAIASGLPLRSIIFRHMLPNGITPVLVSSSFSVASAILLESTLSFLGLGLVDEPSWGQLLNQARAGGTGFVWWMATFPGLAIFLTVFSYNLIGEALRDAIDPTLRKRD